MIAKSIAEVDLENGCMLLIDKPLRWTSFDVVNKLKYLIREESGVKKFKIGHAGTLDPLASGLLIVCVGKFTKQIAAIQQQTKQYIGSFTIGATTASFDLEKPVEQIKPYQYVNRSLIEETLSAFRGEITQIPPTFSAVKVAGRRAFDLARNGETVAIAAKSVNIYHFEVTKIDLPQIDFLIDCSKGTYIRSIARDFGEKLGCGAYLNTLRRTKIGDFSVEQALDFTLFINSDRQRDEKRKKKDFELS